MYGGEGSNLRLRMPVSIGECVSKGNLDLEKFFEDFGTLALSGTCYVGTMGFRPVTMLQTNGQRLGL